MKTFTIEIKIQANRNPREWIEEAIYVQLDESEKEDIISVVTTDIEENT
jgi:signal recognition particle subunit SEC65